MAQGSLRRPVVELRWKLAVEHGSYVREGSFKLASAGLLRIALVTAVIWPGGAVGDSAPKAFQEFEASLSASLPRCFSTTDHATMAKAISSTAIRCEPHSIMFGYDDPTPMKVLCMAKENFRDSGTAVMQPPLLILVVDQGCITKKARH
jgi:hypothetical protein